SVLRRPAALAPGAPPLPPVLLLAPLRPPPQPQRRPADRLPRQPVGHRPHAPARHVGRAHPHAQSLLGAPVPLSLRFGGRGVSGGGRLLDPRPPAPGPPPPARSRRPPSAAPPPPACTNPASAAATSDTGCGHSGSRSPGAAA